MNLWADFKIGWLMFWATLFNLSPAGLVGWVFGFVVFAAVSKVCGWLVWTFVQWLRVGCCS